MLGVLLSREWQQTADEQITLLAAVVVSCMPISDSPNPHVLAKDLGLKHMSQEIFATCRPVRYRFDFEDSWYSVYLCGWFSLSSDPIKRKALSMYYWCSPHMVCSMKTKGWADKAILCPIGSKRQKQERQCLGKDRELLDMSPYLYRIILVWREIPAHLPNLRWRRPPFSHAMYFLTFSPKNTQSSSSECILSHIPFCVYSFSDPVLRTNTIHHQPHFFAQTVAQKNGRAASV